MPFLRLVLLLPLLLALTMTAARAADLSISVDPMVFEFKAGYGNAQQASVYITNTGSATEQISVRAVDWHVAANGNVSLGGAGATRSRSLTPYLTLAPSLFVLRRGESRTLTVSLQMPAAGLRPQAALWGGFLLEATQFGSSAGTRAGATVFVYDSPSAATPRLTLRSLSVVRYKQQRMLAARIANYSDTYARPIVHVVLKRDEKVVQDRVVPVNALLPGDDRVVLFPLLPAPRGDYQVDLVVDYGDALLDGTTHVRLP